jgi:hypothetical protein
LDVISIVLAKERAQALLAKTGARKQRELQEEKNKNMLVLTQGDGQENVMDDIERRDASDSEGVKVYMLIMIDNDSGDLRKPIVIVRKMRRGVKGGGCGGGECEKIRVCFWNIRGLGEKEGGENLRN